MDQFSDSWYCYQFRYCSVNNLGYIIIKISIKITFEEAKTVFYDEYALIINDPEHSKDIDRREGANMEKEYD